MFYKLSKQGIAALTTMLLLGAIMVETLVSLVTINGFLASVGSASVGHSEALVLATSGIQDGLRRLMLDSGFALSEPYVPWSDGLCTEVTISNSDNKKIIIATAVSRGKKRSLQVKFYVDSETGALKVQSIQEVPVFLEKLSCE